MGYDKKNKNPKTATEARDAASAANILARRANRGSDNLVSFRDWDAIAVRDAIATVLEAGVSIQFSFTKTGEAVVIRLWDGVNTSSEYVRPTEDSLLYLTGLAEDFRK